MSILTLTHLICHLFWSTFGLSLNDYQPSAIKMHPGKNMWSDLSKTGTVTEMVSP